MGNGERLGLRHLNYTYQKGHGGIAEALGLCAHWADGEPICVILGDNFEYQLSPGLRLLRAIKECHGLFKASP